MKRFIEEMIVNNRRSRMTFCIAALLISLSILLLASFAAFTYSAAAGRMEDAEKDLAAVESYYRAESSATAIIAGFQQDRRNVSANLNGITEEDTESGPVEVTKIDGRLYFMVPVDKSTFLDVEASVTRRDIRIIRWRTE